MCIRDRKNILRLTTPAQKTISEAPTPGAATTEISVMNLFRDYIRECFIMVITDRKKKRDITLSQDL